MTVQPQVSASPAGSEVNKSLEDEAGTLTHAIRETGAGDDMEILQDLQEVLVQEGATPIMSSSLQRNFLTIVKSFTSMAPMMLFILYLLFSLVLLLLYFLPV